MLCLLVVALMPFAARAAALSVVSSASPSGGPAPLAVFFDASGTTGDAPLSFQWQFGDGLFATSAQVSHVYNVAGNYTATLVVTDGNNIQSSPATFIITVTGTGAGNVTAGMSYRLAPTQATLKINRKVPNADSFVMHAAFNSVDLPPTLINLAANVKINGFEIDGIITMDTSFSNPPNSRKPTFFVFLDLPAQAISVTISKANIASFIPAALDATITAPIKIPVTISFTIGAQTYDITINLNYTALKGVSAQGVYNLTKPSPGDIGQGFFVISKASAIEVPNTKSHFFEFDGYISESNGVLIDTPPIGTPVDPSATWTFTFNEADKIVVPIDRFSTKNNLITFTQPNRADGGVHTLIIDTLKRTFVITTWDVKSNANIGGTGMPVIGEAFLTFNFTLRLDLDQFDSMGNKIFTLSVVTNTLLSRKTIDDAFWQTGRQNKPG